jgi:putative hemolysin
LNTPQDDPYSSTTPLHLYCAWPLLSGGLGLQWGTSTILFVILISLLVFTAIVSGSEVAFFSLNAKDINYLKSKNKGVNKIIINLLEQPQRLLATLLITNSFFSIGIIIISNVLIEGLLDFSTILGAEYAHLSKIFNTLVQVVVVTFLLVLFGEVLPKVYASQNNMRMSLLCAPIINFFNKLLKPLSAMLARSSALIEKNINNKRNNISNVDVEHAIELTVGHSATKEEVNIYKGIIKFHDITVKQIMRPRLDVSGIPYNINFADVQQQVLACGYSRIPVFDGTIDTVKGILHTKDLLPFITENQPDWHQLIRPALFVHENKLIEDLLKDFQKKRIHMAIVVDEFGGTSGIVTLEDIMEEIVGDIRDEFDEDDNMVKKINDHTYICDAKVLINDACRALIIPVDTFEEVRGESDTLAGLVLELAGKFPIVGQTFTYKQYSFMVMELNKFRITKVKIMLEHVQEDN